MYLVINNNTMSDQLFCQYAKSACDKSCDLSVPCFKICDPYDDRLQHDCGQLGQALSCERICQNNKEIEKYNDICEQKKKTACDDYAEYCN